MAPAPKIPTFVSEVEVNLDLCVLITVFLGLFRFGNMRCFDIALVAPKARIKQQNSKHIGNKVSD
ncbi:hypothetical protein GCM10007978_21480 [Shewanella hanedai]|nr:hypothetical protein GCM10007978_21480 [Shewanella hanedai]